MCNNAPLRQARRSIVWRRRLPAMSTAPATIRRRFQRFRFTAATGRQSL
jgi:hypothetical protein